jgi:hypothetical protein
VPELYHDAPPWPWSPGRRFVIEGATVRQVSP